MPYDEIDYADARVLDLLERGYTLVVQLDEYSRREVILTSPSGAKFLAYGDSEEEAFSRVLEILKWHKEVSK